MGYTPTYDARSLSVHIGTVGGGAMTAGSANLGPVGFTPLPGHATAQYFTVADVGRIVTVLGAGASGGILIAKIASYVDTQNVVLTVAASTSVAGDQSNVTVFRPCSVMKDELGHSTSLTSRDSARFTVRSLDGTFVPVEGQPVLLVSTDPAVGIYDYGVFFGGSIDSVKVQNYPGNTMLTSECDCISWENLAAKRVMMGRKYLGKTAAYIFSDIVQAGLVGDCVGVNAVTGSTIPELTIDDYTVVSDALDTLTQKISDAVDVYYWKADPFRRYVLALQTTTAAPWSIDHATGSDNNILASISATRTRERYSNHAYLEASQRLLPAQTYTVKIGTTPVAPPPGFHSRSITLPAVPVVMPSMTLDGTPLVILPSGDDPRIDGSATNPTGADWVWLVGTDRIWTDLSHPGLTVGHTIVVTYQTAEAGHSFYENGPGVAQRSAIEGGSGYYETLTNVDRPLSQDELDDLAESVANRFGTVPTIVDIETYRPGLRVGQELTINRREVAGTFVVSSVDMSVQNGRPHWSIQATNGSVIGDWRSALAAALGGSVSVAGGGGGGVRLGAPPLPLALTAALPSGTVGVAYSGPLIATGGTAPYAFSVASGSLPTWATLGAESGVITGTPTYAGTTTFTARVTDSASITQDYVCTLVVVAAAVGGGTGAIPPNNVTIDSVEADAKPLTGSAVRGTRNSVAKRGITIRYTPPDVTYVPSTITFAQGKSLALGWGYVSSVSLTLDASVSTGQLILVAIRWDSDYSLPLSVSDSAGNSYTLINETGRSSAGWYHQAVYYAYAASSGTVTISGSWTGGDGFSPSISAAVFSGASGAPEATDVTEVSYSGTSSIASGSITPAETGCAIVSFAGSNGAITFSGAGGSLLASQTATDHAIGCTYQVLSSTAAATNGVGYVSGDAYVGVLTTVLFRAATTASSTFKGVYVQIEAPDQTAAYATRGGRPGRFLDGSLALSSVDLSGPRAPYTFGPFPHSETDGSLRVQIPEPDASQLPMNARARVISYSDDVTNSADTSPSQTFVIADPTPSKPASGTAYTFNPVRVLIPATVPGSGVRGAAQANPYRTTASGVDETHLWVTIDLDPRAYGYQLVLVDPWGDHLSASGIETAPHFELVFNTPGAVGTYVVYACGSDGTNINPLVDGITPSVAVTLGTDDGTVDLKQTTANSRGRGLDVEDDALCVKIAGPLYEDVAGNINLKISPHFTVSTDGTLTQDIVDLSLATGFDTSAFSGGGGGSSLTIKASWITAQAIAVNQLVAGNALFAGDATFARVSGGKVTINSAGVAIADNLTTPTATVTATSSGVTVAKGSNNVQVTASGVSVNGPSGSLTATSSGVVIANGSSSVTVSSSAVTIVNGSLSSPTITGGSISGASLSISSGTTTVNIDSANYVRVFDSNVSATCRMAPGAIEVLGNLDSSQAALQTASGVGILRLRNGANTVTFELYPVTSSTANAGVATLPSNPAGFISAKVNGITVKIPYYGN